jgi:hypothetical protein
VALAGGRQEGLVDHAADVLELAGAGELGTVDQVQTHQVGHVTRGQATRQTIHHRGVLDVLQVDEAIGVAAVPGADQGVDHLGVATGPLPHRHCPFDI